MVCLCNCQIKGGYFRTEAVSGHLTNNNCVFTINGSDHVMLHRIRHEVGAM